MKKINSKNIRLKLAVTEIVGTILLLTISIALFSVVYFAFFSIQPSSPSPSSDIAASVEKDKIIFEHRSGEPLSLDTRILLNIGGNKFEVKVGDILEDANGDGLWNIGERLVYTGTDLESLQTEATVVDVRSNSVIMQGILKEGVTIENPYIITKPAIVLGSRSVELSMNYNFKDFDGYLRFLYKKSDEEWVIVGESPLMSGWGIYDFTVNGLIPNTLYTYKAQLEYDSKIIEGIELKVFTLGTIVGEWHLNSGSGIIAVDSSGFNNNGTLYNKPQWTTDKINGSYALSFDGIDDYVLVNDDNSLDILTNNISIEAWIKPLDHSKGFFGDIANSPIDVSDFGILECLEHDIIKIYNNIYAIVLRGTNNKGFLVTVEISSDGQINNKIIDKFEFESIRCYDPNIIHINNSNIYIIAYTGPSYDGFLVTVEIANNGLITHKIISILEFDTVNCGDPNIIHVTDLIYAVVYTGSNNDGYLKTIRIANDGQINNVINTTIFDMASTVGYAAEEFEIIHLDGNNFVIIYRNKDGDGELRTVRIENDGSTLSPYHSYPEGYYIDSFLFDRDDGWTPNIVHIYGNIFAVAYGGFQSPSTDGWLKTIKISNDGNNYEIIDNLEFDPEFATETNIIHVNGNIYAIVYRGTDNDGFLKTIEILNNGQIADTVNDSLEFDEYDCYEPRIINIGLNYCSIVYTGPDYDGFLKTIYIADSGLINYNVIDDLEIGMFDYSEPNIIPISGNIYAMVYRGLYDDGYIRTLEISNIGQINDNPIDIFEFEKQYCSEPNIIHVYGSVYAIVYSGPNSHGFLVTVEIANDGLITDSIIDVLEFDLSYGEEPEIIHISGSVYAIVYSGPNSHGFLVTVEIANDGLITDSIIDVLEFDLSYGCDTNIISIYNNIFAIAYRGVSNYGYLKTVEILSNGQINKTIIDSLIFDNSRGYDPEITHVLNDVYAIVYSRTTWGGYLSTVKIEVNGLISDSVIDTLRFDNINNPSSDSDCFEPDIIHINDQILAIAYEGQYDGYLKTLRIGENGDITDQNDDTLIYDIDGWNSNIIHVSNDIYAITCRRSNYDGYVVTVSIKQKESVGKVIAKENAYKIYANTTTVFAYINNYELKAPISSGFNYVVLTYNKNAGSNNMKLYVNATEKINRTLTVNINKNNNNLYIGGLNCIIDEIFVHEVEISKAEITQRYNDYKA